MRRAAIVVLAGWIAGACSTGTSAGRAPEPAVAGAVALVDSVPARPAAVDLSGSWTTGSGAEPTVPRIVYPLQCNHTPAHWIIEQRADTVRTWAFPESQAQGIAVRHPVATQPLVGRLSGVQLEMGGGAAHYLLRYDSTTGHLRGTLGSRPFWAIRLQLVRPNGCLPVP